jgi:polar amino acid transport system substrate-binding protein
MLTQFFRFPFLLLTGFILFLNSCGEFQKKVYEIALDPLFIDSDFKNNDNNVLGFSTELLRAVSKESNTPFSILYTSWEGLLSGLDADKYPGILSSLPPYTFNCVRYDFSELYLPSGPVLILPLGSPYHTLKDIKNKQIAVLANSPGVLILEAYPNISILSCESEGDIINQLQSGQASGALLPLLSARSYTRGSFKGQFAIASHPLNNEGLRLITKKKQNTTLIRKFNKVLKQMKKDGRYEKLLEEWKLNAPPSS